MSLLRSVLFLLLLSPLLLACRSNTADAGIEITEANDSVPQVTDSLVADGNADVEADADLSEEEEEHSSPAVVYSDDDIIYVYADMRQDFRMFGYAEPDTTSRKMILYSIFTYDVESNPYHCPFGAYYETNGLMNGKLRIISKDDPQFIKAEILDIDIPGNTSSNIVYFLKGLISFKD